MQNKRVIFILLMFFLLLNCVSCQKKYVTNLNHLEKKPTIDFLQPWNFCQYKLVEMNIHFMKLKEFGIDTVIIQNVANFNKGKMEISYYDTSASVETKYANFLDMVFSAAQNTSMNIILGLSFDEYWWDDKEHRYNDDSVHIFLKNDVFVLEELVNQYKPDGWYLSNEMYSNTSEYENNWSYYINEIIQYIDCFTPNTPLYISPFLKSNFIMTKNQTKKMWTEFLKNTNFREIDVFMPQDGYGNAAIQYSINKENHINMLNYMIWEVCKNNSKAKFYLNLELYAKNGYADVERIMHQIAFANEIAEGIATFSISHYYIADDTVCGKRYIDALNNYGGF